MVKKCGVRPCDHTENFSPPRGWWLCHHKWVIWNPQSSSRCWMMDDGVFVRSWGMALLALLSRDCRNACCCTASQSSRHRNARCTHQDQSYAYKISIGRLELLRDQSPLFLRENLPSRNCRHNSSILLTDYLLFSELPT